MRSLATSEASLAKQARRQGSSFHRLQALRAGFTNGEVRRRLDSGAWTLVYPEVMFHTSVRALSHIALCSAAVLQMDGKAVVSRASALHVWGVLEAPDSVHVTLKCRRGGRTPGLILHTSRSFPKSDTGMYLGLPVSTIERSCIDALGDLPDECRVDVLAEVLRSRHCSPSLLAARALALRHPKRPGAGLVCDALGYLRSELATESPPARDLLHVLRELPIPAPEVEFVVVLDSHTFRLDFAWPAEKVFLEYDGWLSHSSRDDFERDRRRQNLLVAAGWVPVRVTRWQIDTFGVVALDPLIEVLSTRSAATS